MWNLLRLKKETGRQQPDGSLVSSILGEAAAAAAAASFAAAIIMMIIIIAVAPMLQHKLLCG